MFLYFVSHSGLAKLKLPTNLNEKICGPRVFLIKHNAVSNNNKKRRHKQSTANAKRQNIKLHFLLVKVRVKKINLHKKGYVIQTNL